MDFKIGKYEVYGLDYAIKASGNPMRVAFDREEVTEKDIKRCVGLGTCKGGEGHDNYLKGIVVENPLFVSVLGTCPALATTTSIEGAIGMGILFSIVLICSNKKERPASLMIGTWFSIAYSYNASILFMFVTIAIMVAVAMTTTS